MKYGICAALLVAFSASALLAGEGVPSSAKLNKLGLNSMQVASDQAGEEVRGQGFGFIGMSMQVADGAGGVVVPFQLAFTFGTETLSSADPQYRQGVGGTVAFNQNANGSVDPTVFVNTPIEFSTTSTTGGITTVTTFKLHGVLFANGN